MEALLSLICNILILLYFLFWQRPSYLFPVLSPFCLSWSQAIPYVESLDSSFHMNVLGKIECHLLDPLGVAAATQVE